MIICQLAREKYGVETTIARVNDPRNQPYFDLLGISPTVSATASIMGLIEHEVPGARPDPPARAAQGEQGDRRAHGRPRRPLRRPADRQGRAARGLEADPRRARRQGRGARRHDAAGRGRLGARDPRAGQGRRVPPRARPRLSGTVCREPGYTGSMRVPRTAPNLKRMRRPLAWLALAATLLVVPAASGSSDATSTRNVVQIGTFDSPVYLTAPRTERGALYVVEQGGRIVRVAGGKRTHLPRHHAAGAIGRRAGSARARVPPALREERPLLHRLHDDRTAPRHRRVPRTRRQEARCARAC